MLNVSTDKQVEQEKGRKRKNSDRYWHVQQLKAYCEILEVILCAECRPQMSRLSSWDAGGR